MSGDLEENLARRPAPTATVPGGGEATVRSGALVVQGGIAQGEVQRVLRGATPRMRACYTQQLQSNRSLRGHMDLQVLDGCRVVASFQAIECQGDRLGSTSHFGSGRGFWLLGLV